MKKQKYRVVKKGKLILYYDKKGWLQMVRNPSGTKRPVYIYQGHITGFSVSYTKSNKSLPIKGHQYDAEGLAKRLGRAGHKRVTFRD